jgi:gliding motility-associated-like protein
MKSLCRNRLLLNAILVLLVLCPALAWSAPVILETFPPRGSVQTLPCGPFGARLEAGSLVQPENALTVRGSATGLRQQGDLSFSTNGDTLLFTPIIPFAPGEEVTISLGGHSWQTIIRPTEDNRSESLDLMQPRAIDLSGHFPSGDLEFMAWSWADLNADRDQECVLLASSDGLHYLVTVARDQNPDQGTDQWQVRAPAVCDADNPVDVKAIDLDGDSSQDLVLLTLSGLQYWRNPGATFSPNGAQATSLSFPASFHSRTMERGDVDGDGDDDLVVLGLFGFEYLVILNDGQGLLLPQIVQTAGQNILEPADKSLPWPIHTLLKDADGDGAVDLIWAAEYQEQSSYRVHLAKGLGDGGFEPAEIMAETPDFSRGLLFGRLLDSWDDSLTPPALLNATPDQGGGGNLCGFVYDGNGPATPVGCLTAGGLEAQSIGISVSHILSADQPELWYADPLTGTLTACILNSSQSVETRQLPLNVAALGVGDFDFDGDGDVAVLSPADKTIVLLETAGGHPRHGPVSDGVACGGTMDFGVREVGCSADAPAAFLPFTNEGLLPSRIISVALDDPAGVFSIPDWPSQWFGGGCMGPSAAVMLPVGFAPNDTINFLANMAVTVKWIGAAADGADSTVVCDFELQGRGGIHRVDGLVSLGWTAADGYSTTGASMDFGSLPALSEVAVSTTVSLTNTGHLPVEVVPPVNLSEPFVVLPVGPRPLAPGQTRLWDIQVNPYAGLVPAEADSIALTEFGSWTISALTPLNCLPTQAVNQELSVRLLSAAPCLAPDPDCTGAAVVCAESDTITVTEDGVLSYCLNRQGWTWPGAQPQLRTVENPMDWLGIEELTAVDDSWPVVHLTSDLVGAVGGDLQLELRDANHPTIVRPFTLTVMVEESRPDLSIVDMMFLPAVPDGDIQQQHPFLVDVIVEVTRHHAEGAVVALEGGLCSCGVGPLDKIMINLMEGYRDTVRFVVESCDDAGDCPFTACVEPAAGLAHDFNPDNNCFTLGTMVAANRAPAIEISNLVLTPDDPALEPCQRGITLNEISGGMVQAFGVREENNLSFDVHSRDEDGDNTRLTVGLLPPFVVATAFGDTMVSFSITPPEGTVTSEVCEEFGPLVFQVTETGSALPETTLVEIPLFVKWEGPDLEASLSNVPTSAGLAEDIRFNGRIRCLGYDAGPFSVDMWLENPDGVRVAGRQVDYNFLEAGGIVSIPQVLFNVDRPGDYCAHIAITSGRDVNPDNNSAEICFPVAAGPFTVSPNVATPNGDGHNDAILFRFLNQTMENPKIRIFELNGHQVFETDRLDGERNLVWNGRNQNGDPMPPGTYLYVVYNDGREFRTGTCGVIR